MRENTNSRRRRHHYRPQGGLHAKAKPIQPPTQSERQEMVGGNSLDEPIYQRSPQESAIERSENLAAGLPETGIPIADTQEEIAVEEIAPVAPSKPKTFTETIRQVAQKVIQKVQNIIPRQPINKEIIINAESLETRVAVIENSRLEEFNIERNNEVRVVASIFKGKIKNLEDRLEAAFVDIGIDKNAFLHYWDIIPSSLDSRYEVIERQGKRREQPRLSRKDIPKKFPVGTDIIVQVTKGAIGTKGPRITTHLAIPGRYLVLLPNSDQCGISKKIQDSKERQRLRQLVQKLEIPDNMGVIVRTAAAGMRVAYLVRDLEMLKSEWTSVREKIEKENAPVCVFREPELIERTVRDFLTEDVDRIVIDNPREYKRMVELVTRISPMSKKKLKLYEEPQPVFDRFDVTRQLEAAFSRKVVLKSGGYLVVDETEALVAIDINSGSHKGGKNQESTIIKVNMDAVEEICRQLRLRNIGGLIVVDFIDMRNGNDRRQVYQKMCSLLQRDRAKTHVLQISDLGLLEMTRQRHSESVQSSVYDECHYCKGRGILKSPLTMSVEIQRKLAEILKKRGREETDFQLRIAVNPTVLARLRQEDEHLLIDMEKRYYGKLAFRAEPSFHTEQFKIHNAVTNEELVSVGEPPQQ